MDYGSNDNAFAVWTGRDWILKPACPLGAFPANAGAVWTGDDWVLTPATTALAPENAIAVTTALGDRVLLPLRCGESEAGEDGPSPYCSACLLSHGLRSSYAVSISGFPAICSVEVFNGSWTVSHRSDCTWYYDIDAYHRVSLYYNSGSWLVQWTVSSPGGAYGWFLGSGSPACSPDGYTWSYSYCFNPFLCFGLCSGIQSGGSVVVS
jgi:hypothetical protein